MQLYAQMVKTGTPSELIETARMINDILLHDWIIRVQYTITLSPRMADWSQWGNPFYGIKTSDTVIESIQDCHESYPGYAIRLDAEKTRLSTRFLYSVYCPEGDFDENTRFQRYKESAQRLLATERELINLEND